jgi:hypothetical protein
MNLRQAGMPCSIDDAPRYIGCFQATKPTRPLVEDDRRCAPQFRPAVIEDHTQMLRFWGRCQPQLASVFLGLSLPQGMEKSRARAFLPILSLDIQIDGEQSSLGF